MSYGLFVCLLVCIYHDCVVVVFLFFAERRQSTLFQTVLLRLFVSKLFVQLFACFVKAVCF